jgi:hypothetical protein
MATMAVIAAGMVPAEDTVQAAQRHVNVCVEGRVDFGVKPAQAMASEMFAEIGVTVDWRQGLIECPPQGILISLTDRTPPDLRPGAFAYATLNEGQVRLFYDRIAQVKPKLLLPHLLAHVLVHEITHVLEGISRHSAQGVMKAWWTPDDFNMMMWKPLPFTSEDINLIYPGLAARAGSAPTKTLSGVRPRTGNEAGAPVAVAAKLTSR